jgi:hypothetical protein
MVAPQEMRPKEQLLAAVSLLQTITKLQFEINQLKYLLFVQKSGGKIYAI